jgi:TRAP-type mannitol/chloroaromatic compound transport system permease small subunit
MILEASADTSGFPVWPWKLACAVGASLCVLTLLAQLIQKLRPARATAAGEST